MNITIKATNTTLTDAIRSNISGKLEVLQKFLRPENNIHVELAEDIKHKSGEFFRVDVSISPSGVYARARANDFYEAIDLVLPKLTQQLSKNKDKKISLRRKLGDWFKRS